MDEQNMQDMRQNDLFTGDEAREIAEANAPQPPGPSALERAAQRIAAVQGRRSGMTPTEAYQTVRMRQMQADSEARQSAQRAVGSLAGDGGPQNTDAFLAGFNHKN